MSGMNATLEEVIAEIKETVDKVIRDELPEMRERQSVTDGNIADIFNRVDGIELRLTAMEDAAKPKRRRLRKRAGDH